MEPFIAEIRIYPYAFVPRGWATCNGQLLSIAQNTALFSLLGTYYGGDGKVTFALPDLRDSTPMCWGQGPGLSYRDLGESGGESAVTLIGSELAGHQHSLYVSTTTANQKQPVGQLFAPGSGVGFYGPNSGATTNLAVQTLGVTGNSAPHNNMQPYLAVQFCISLYGIYPQRPMAKGVPEALGVSEEEIKAWEGTRQGDPDGLGGPASTDLAPGVPEDLDTSAWEGTQQGSAELAEAPPE